MNVQGQTTHKSLMRLQFGTPKSCATGRYWRHSKLPMCTSCKACISYIVRRSSTYFYRSLKREKDQLQQRLDAQQAASVVPQASSADSELQVKGLQEQLSQSEELLQVGGLLVDALIKQHSFMRLLQVASTKSQGVLQCSNKGTASVSHDARQARVCSSSACPEEHSCLTCNHCSSVLGKEGCGYPPALSTSLQASCPCFLCFTQHDTIGHNYQIGVKVANLVQYLSCQVVTSLLVAKTPGTPCWEPLRTVPDPRGRHVNKQTTKQHCCTSQCT